jgi:dipeptidyl aminopeptidase/acylaminoacyl peptidase
MGRTQELAMNAIARTRLAGVIAVLLAAAPHAAAKRPITETDLFKFTWVADPQISPDGSTVAFVRVVVNEKEDRYESSVFAVPTSASQSSGSTDSPRRLTSGIRDTSPRWAPDGKSLAFVRSPVSQSSAPASQSSAPASQSSGSEKDAKTQPQIYLLPLDGGEARALTNLPRGAGSPVWSPDGKAIAFTSQTSAADERPQKSAPSGQSVDERRAAEEGAKAQVAGVGPRDKVNDKVNNDDRHKSDVKVITRAVYRSNGNAGWVDSERHSHIWTIAVAATGSDPGSDPKQLTTGDFDERGIAWAPDGSKLYFTSTRVAEPYYEPSHAELYSVPASGGAITKVAGIEGTIGDISVSHDGKRIAFVGTLHGNPVRSYNQPDLWVTDATPGGTPKNLTATYDFDINGGIGGDQASPRGENSKPIVWTKDGSSLIVVSAEHGSANLRRIAIATGKVEPLSDLPQDVMSYTATPDAATIAAVVSTPTNIGDITIVHAQAAPAGRDTHIAQITRVNDELFKDIAQSDPEEIWYTSFDGRKIQGWILKPPDFDASRKYPMILEIHGGPHAAYGNTYTHEFMWMAAKGYVVLYTNPRGSTSYGQDFGNIIQYHYPGDDYKDLMAGVDEVLKRGYIDATRLGVTGGSGGGLLTNWTITQTQRFKAAVAQRDIADWYGFWFTADFTLFQPTWFRKAPWEDPQDFAARSPITHVANVTTPLMLVLGDTDYRTPPADGGEMMFRALKYRKIPTVMVRFPRETHELSRSGEPWHRVERLRHIVGWMDQWLQGKKSESYTLQ